MPRLNETYHQVDGTKLDASEELSQIVQEINGVTKLPLLPNQNSTDNLAIQPILLEVEKTENASTVSERYTPIDAKDSGSSRSPDVLKSKGLKITSATALAGTAFSLFSGAPSTVAASTNHDLARPNLSAQLTSHTTHRKPSRHQPTPPPVHHVQSPVQKLEIEQFVIKPKTTIYGIAKKESVATGLSLNKLISEIENDNKTLIKRDGGVRDLHVGQVLKVPEVAPKPVSPVHHPQPRQPGIIIEKVVVKKHDDLWRIAEETGLPVNAEVKKIEEDNSALLKHDHGPRGLQPGQVLEVPEEATHPIFPIHHVQSPERSLVAEQEKATNAFKQELQKKHGETWSGGSHAAIKKGEFILYRDPESHTLKVGTVQKVEGDGSERVVVTNKGTCAASQVIEVGKLPTKTHHAVLPNEQTGHVSTIHVPAEMPVPTPAVTPAPSHSAQPSPSPVWAINSNPDGNQSTAGSVAPHDISAEAAASSGTIPSTPAPPPATHSASPETSSSNTVEPLIDYSAARPNLQGVVASGFKGVIRYLGFPGEGKKLLTKAEVANIQNAGLAIGLVWEGGGRDALGGYNAGVRAGKQALVELKDLGVPTSVIPFAAVDFDPTKSQLPTINDYLRGFYSQLGPEGFNIGEYGGGPAVKSALDAGVITEAWQTYAWSRGKWDPRAIIRQYSNHRLVAGGTVDLDKDMSGLSGLWLPPQTANQPVAAPTPSATPTPAPAETPTPSPTPVATPAIPSNPQSVPEPNAVHNFIDSNTNNGNVLTVPVATPNLKQSTSNGGDLFTAIKTASNGNNRQILSMLMGSWLESGWHETSVGAGSYGPFQIQNPGQNGGPHPDITIAQAEDPNYSTNYMSADYAQALSTVPNAEWNANPEKAAEITDYRAEHPAETYFASQGRSRVDQAYKAAVKKMIDLGISTDFSNNS